MSGYRRSINEEKSVFEMKCEELTASRFVTCYGGGNEKSGAKANLLLTLLLVGCGWIGSVSGTEIPIRKKLTLGDVFALGFRPSNITPENLGILRCWESQDIVLSFEGQKYALRASDVTFHVFDDDQVASVEITGDRSHQFTLQECADEARAIYGKFGPVPDDFERWLAGVKKSGMFSSYDRYVDTGHGYWIGVSLQPTLKRIDSTPAIVSLMVKWPYQGTGPVGGLRLKPSKSPAGYDWDMSFQAWSQRVKEAVKKDNAEKERLDASKAIASPSINDSNFPASSDSRRNPEEPSKEAAFPGVPVRSLWFLVGMIFMFLFGWLGLRKLRRSTR